ncbi:UPSTREAM OF FLC protein (DUF966) isoform X2 [Tasmannia lanceolata]
MEDKGGEVRRIHIVYFLSRMGRIEHPHLIRVHHLNRNGVRLRDVKRWLSDLRGKDLPDSFSWSYKRRYKTGYVWQDLLEDDLITPISDNEYVLKGSEIAVFPFDPYSFVEKASSPIQNPDPVEDKQQQFPQEKFSNKPETKADISSEIEVEVDDTSKKEVAFKVEEQEKFTETESLIEKVKEKDGVFYSSSSSSPYSLKNKNREKAKKSPSFSKSKSYSSGASQVFRNLLTCGAVETDDSAVMLINKQKKTEKEGGREICKGDVLGGSERILSGAWNQQQGGRKSFSGTNTSKKTSEFGKQKPVSASYKPVAEPNCSQCGKGFKPERLHSHMKSCKGLKSRGKSLASGKLSQASTEEELGKKAAISGPFLTR